MIKLQRCIIAIQRNKGGNTLGRRGTRVVIVTTVDIVWFEYATVVTYVESGIVKEKGVLVGLMGKKLAGKGGYVEVVGRGGPPGGEEVEGAATVCGFEEIDSYIFLEEEKN